MRYEEDEGRWYKYTTDGGCGFTVHGEPPGKPYLLNATPHEYLLRLRVQNRLFHDDIRLEGIREVGKHQYQFVISQPDMAGPNATYEQIRETFFHMGFRELPFKGLGYSESLAFQRKGIQIWDAHPGNVFMSSAGWAFPIDLFVTMLPPL